MKTVLRVGYDVVKADLSASLDSEENRALASLVVKSSTQIDQGLEELERVAEEMSMLVEAVAGTSKLVRNHISTLQEVANLRGTDLRTLLQQCRSASEQEPAEDRSVPEQAPLAVEAAGQQFEPQPLLWGQG